MNNQSTTNQNTSNNELLLPPPHQPPTPSWITGCEPGHAWIEPVLLLLRRQKCTLRYTYIYTHTVIELLISDYTNPHF